MGKKNYVKLCQSCLKTFVAGCNANCPYCGSGAWRHVDQCNRPLPGIGNDTMRRVVENIPMENGDVLIVTRRVPPESRVW